MAGPSQLFYTQVMVGKESSWGSSASRTISLPSEQPQFQPIGYRHIVDTGLRNAAGLEFDLLPGPGEGNFQWAGNVYADTIIGLLSPMIGADVIGGANPYTHTFASSKTPNSLSVEWGNANQAYLMLGARPSQMTLSFNGRDGALTYTVQGMGKIGTTLSQTTFVAETVSALTGWQGSITVAGSGVTAPFMEGTITFTRGLKVIHGLTATQDVANIYALPLQIQAQLTFDWNDTVVYNYFSTSAAVTKNAVVITFTQSSSNIFKLTMTSAGWRIVTPTASDNIYTAVAQINGLYNATDAGPGVVVVTNAITPGF
jgi:hypothetical protein